MPQNISDTELKMTKTQELIQNIGAAQECCVALATGGKASYEDYEAHRSILLSYPLVQGRLPNWLVECRFGAQFWSFMKKTSAHYKERREFLWNDFNKLLTFVENHGVEPTSLSIDELLKTCTSSSVSDAWKRCFERRERAPEGAITSARTMLEAVCKYVLDEMNQPYSEKDDLPMLYKSAASTLSLSPDQHKEKIFKQILSGCGSVVNGLASMRNAFGDAHGKGKQPLKPSARHAELAINLSGAICSFLIATFEQRKK